jgi:hypothetical protein
MQTSRKFHCFSPSLTLTRIRQTKKGSTLDRQQVYEFTGLGVHISTENVESCPIIFIAKFYGDGTPVCDPEMVSLSGVRVSKYNTDSYSWIIASMLQLPTFSPKVHCKFIGGGVNEFTQNLKNAQMRINNFSNGRENPFLTFDIKSLDFEFLKRNAINLSGYGISNIKPLLEVC